MRNDISEIKCISCEKTFSIDKVNYTCPLCGEIFGTLNVCYSKKVGEKINPLELKKNSEFSIKRYLPILPVDDTKLPFARVGMTPIYKLQEGDFYIKDDTRNPSGSLKDRASWVCVADALQRGFQKIAVASTGNAASALATIAVTGGIQCIVFCPENAPEEKLVQMQIMGANVFMIRGNYDDAFDLLQKVAKIKGWYLRSTAVNPLCTEGKKTVALEIWEQLNYKVPDKIFVPVGDGCIYSAIYKGFKDLFDIGICEKIPKVIGVQAEGASPLVSALNEGKQCTERIIPKTIADSISVGFPRDQIKVLKFAREYNGEIIKVSDDEIIQSISSLALKTGIFAEPSASASYAGFVKYLKEEKIKKDEKVVVIITGTGLKDIKSAMKAGKGKSFICENSLNSVLLKINDAGI